MFKVKDIYGHNRNVKYLSKYLIDWEGPSRSKFQKKVKDFLAPYWRYGVVFEEFPVPRTRLSVDFFNSSRNIVVEVQGWQHDKYVPYFHGKANKIGFLDQLKRDKTKRKFCEANGFIMVEIYPDDKIRKELFKKQGVDL